MILDSTLVFHKNGSLAALDETAAIVPASSNNVLQLDLVKRFLTGSASARYDFSVGSANAINDIARGGEIWLNIIVGSTALVASSTTITEMVVHLRKKASASSIESGTIAMSFSVLNITSSAGNNGHVAAGKYLVRSKLPPDLIGDTTKPYIGITYQTTTASHDMGAGTVTAWLGGPDDTTLR